MNESKIILLTIKEASEFAVGLSQYHIRMLVRCGQLPCIKAGRKYFINKDILIRYLNNELC